MYVEDRNDCTVFCIQLTLLISSVKPVWLQRFIHNHCELQARVFIFPTETLSRSLGSQQHKRSWDGRIIYVVKCSLYSIDMKPKKLTFVLGLENLEDTKVDLVCFFQLTFSACFLSVISFLPLGRKS